MSDPLPARAGSDRLRASDADREAVVERLRQAHSEGRLDLTEFDERTRNAYAARTYAELAPLTSDLPVQADPVAQAPAASGPPAARLAAAPARSGRGAPLSHRVLGSSWFFVSLLTFSIWAVTCIASGSLLYPWWIWVAGPWGAVLLANWLSGRFREQR